LGALRRSTVFNVDPGVFRVSLLSVAGLIVSFVMVTKGASWLTDSIWNVSVRRKISAGMLGMAVAGLMTTLPEFTVSTMASGLKSTGLSVGNAIGSTIFNILGIVGICGLVRPLRFDKSFLSDYGRNALMVYLVFYALSILGRSLGFVDGVILLLVLAASLYYGYRRRHEGAPDSPASSRSGSKDVILLLAGAGLLGSGAYVLIYSAKDLASTLGIPEFIIGLSLVAVGTSIPELATGLTSVKKGVEEISVGNVLGANIYNVTLVLGASAIISTLVNKKGLPTGGTVCWFDIPVMILATALFVVVGRNGRIDRKTALSFIFLYAVYIAATYTII